MARSKTARLRILSHVIAGYMLLAFSWWTILLLNKNKEAFDARIALMHERQDPELNDNIYPIEEDFRKQRLMILGEGLVFILALLIGIWLINRGYVREIEGIRQKRNFLLAITHELKSPLASIRLTLETFVKRDLDPTDRNRLGTNALTETDRLTGLIDNLLLAAKLDKSYQPVFEKIDLLEIINQVRSDLLNLFPDSKIRIGASENKIESYVDHQGIYSTIYNICENAIKYSKERPQINILVEKDQNGIQIEVSDQGIGISEVDKRKIFDQFYRVGNEEIRQSTGTGLGLYIASRMIAIHHGKIRVSDNKPTGTRFSIQLPLSSPT